MASVAAATAMIDAATPIVMRGRWWRSVAPPIWLAHPRTLVTGARAVAMASGPAVGAGGRGR